MDSTAIQGEAVMFFRYPIHLPDPDEKPWYRDRGAYLIGLPPLLFGLGMALAGLLHVIGVL